MCSNSIKVLFCNPLFNLCILHGLGQTTCSEPITISNYESRFNCSPCKEDRGHRMGSAGRQVTSHTHIFQHIGVRTQLCFKNVGTHIHLYTLQEEISVCRSATCSPVGLSIFLSQHACWDNLVSIHISVEAFGITWCLLFTADGTVSSAHPKYYLTRIQDKYS